MWTFLAALIPSMLAGAFAGAAYVYKRRAERRPERDAIEIEQTRVKLLADVSALLENTDATVRERTAPVVTALIESSLKALGPPKKPLTAAERLEAENERRKRERAEHDERIRKIEAESAEQSRKHQQTMIDFYRRPLENNAMALCIYAVKAAQAHARARDLGSFNEDWEIFKAAARDWMIASDEDQKPKAKALIAEMDNRLRALLGELDKALKPASGAQQAAELPASQAKAELPSGAPADGNPSDS